MNICPIVITGPIGAGKSTLCSLLEQKLNLEYIREYIDLENGENMLAKFKNGEISNQVFQDYILDCFDSQLQQSKTKVVIMERMPQEGPIIFCNNDKSILDKASKLQMKYFKKTNNPMRVITVINSGQSPKKLMNEVLGRIFGTKYVSYDNIKILEKTSGVIIYLKTSSEICLNRIKLRNRAPEKSISINYLDVMNRLYDQYISNFKLY